MKTTNLTPNQTYLVTGSTGYIGRHLVAGLLETEPRRVFGLTLPGAEPLQTGSEAYTHLEADLLSDALPGLLEELQPDVLFHAVGVDRAAPLKDQLNVYVEGTRHLLQSVVDARLATRVVLLGSAAEYGLNPEPVDEATVPKPVSEYGVSKLAQTIVAQLYARKYHVPVIVARVFNAYGQSPQGFAIAAMASQLARQESQQQAQGVNYPRIKVHNLESFRDFIHIDDVVRGLMALGERGYPGETYNLASGQAVPLRLVLEGLLAVSTLKQVEIVPEVPQETDFSQAGIQKIIAHTGWRPQVSLEHGLMRELAYWRERVAFAGRV